MRGSLRCGGDVHISADREGADGALFCTSCRSLYCVEIVLGLEAV